MKYFLIVLLAIIFVVAIEFAIYLFFAFCNWEINWIPNTGVFVRFIYAFTSYVGAFLGVSLSKNCVSDFFED